ncbi:uncharacterized protein LOC112263870 isoform X1 [Oncorhynchus tshawytscha]|uniref:uncharacterized protein LOC112263870 isoform X1 n=1 Tax=Oncorhynchus tshawytscha TaxID=74940 RepID=UPI000D09C0E0|nr:uncharacterized protein LOC112263870 isoform X1 [Oncorhynchus tshawytscha]
MNFRSCLSVAVIWFLSSSQSNSVLHSGIRYLRVTRGGSVTLPITDGQCPESDFGLCTERKGPVVTYENNVITEGPNYLGRIQLMNDSNGCAVVVHNVTEEDTKTVYYTDGGLPGQLRIVLEMTNITESSTTTAAPQQSTTTRGGSTESLTTTAAPQQSSTTPGLLVEHLAGLVPVGGLVVVVVCIRICKNKNLKEEPPLAELQVLIQNASMDTAEQ